MNIYGTSGGGGGAVVASSRLTSCTTDRYIL